MPVRDFVDEVLCVPITRIGSRYITEAIEIVLDTHDIKFYPRLVAMTHINARQLEKSIRDARLLSLRYMSSEERVNIFGEGTPNNSEYILKATEYYRRKYANKD